GFNARSGYSDGIDYLKYDWCSYSQIAKDASLAELQKLYRPMRASLDTGSIGTFALACVSMATAKFGNGVQASVETHGERPAISPTRGSAFRASASANTATKITPGPGHRNDPDMLVVGRAGWGPNVHPTRLSRNEQMTHITLWSLVSSPLLIGCDMSEVDKFTGDVLSNDEVLAVNQDALEKTASRRWQD